MKVKVSYLGYIRVMLGKREEEMELKEGATIGDLLNMLSDLSLIHISEPTRPY